MKNKIQLDFMISDAGLILNLSGHFYEGTGNIRANNGKFFPAGIRNGIVYATRYNGDCHILSQGGDIVPNFKYGETPSRDKIDQFTLGGFLPPDKSVFAIFQRKADRDIHFVKMEAGLLTPKEVKWLKCYGYKVEANWLLRAMGMVKISWEGWQVHSNLKP